MSDRELVVKMPEEEYINIKDAINSLIENGVKRASLSKVCLAILDSTPLPKGHWEHGKELCKEYQGRILVDVTYLNWHCSNCNYVIKGTVKPKWNYCPNCGADMQM